MPQGRWTSGRDGGRRSGLSRAGLDRGARGEERRQSQCDERRPPGCLRHGPVPWVALAGIGRGAVARCERSRHEPVGGTTLPRERPERERLKVRPWYRGSCYPDVPHLCRSRAEAAREQEGTARWHRWHDGSGSAWRLAARWTRSSIGRRARSARASTRSGSMTATSSGTPSASSRPSPAGSGSPASTTRSGWRSGRSTRSPGIPSCWP